MSLAAVITDRAYLAEFEAAKAASAAFPVPPDFEELASQSNYALARHYGVNAKVVQRWRSKVGLTNPRSRDNSLKPVPTDFDATAREMSNRDLRERYGVGFNTISRWRKERGIAAPNIKPTAHQYRKMPVAQKRSYAWSLPTVRPIDGSDDARAAAFLKRFATTYRCDEQGRYCEKGKLWRYGNVIQTPDEMIARAKRQGWSA